MVWELHNEQVIQKIGWDPAPPIWPYQTAWILLQGINAPAFVIVLLLFKVLRAETHGAMLFLELPAVILWWWFIGWRVDSGLLPRKTARPRLFWGIAVGIVSLAFWSCGSYIVMEQIRFWSEYGERDWVGPMLFFVRQAGPLFWCFLLGLRSAAAASRFIISTQRTP